MPNLSEAQITLRRLWPRLKEKYAARTTAADWQAFHTRLETHFPRLLSLLVKIYPGRYDLYYHLEKLLEVCTEAWLARAPELKTIDAEREENPRWFQSQQMLAGVCYVDLFAGNLQGLREKIPYFKELGLTYLHLMPLFKAPEGNSDGGYAVSSYREVNPALGNIDELRALAAEMRQNGISLCVDFIFNHTSDEHEWAKRALAGDPDYADFYFFFPDRQMPDAYERNVREIFPDEHPGAFSPLAQWGVPGNGWVWTTFHRFQWDLNYSNPAVFTAMAGEMLFIANLGVDVLRMDAVAFIWKRLGTVCENLPEAHWLIQAFNAVCRMAAPSLLFKSEAIVHPDDVNKYIHPEECQLSYNPLLMALLWNSLATRKVRLLSHSMRHRFAIHPDTAWVNYVRVHDDIGWTFSDEDAQSLGINGYDHRRFLNNFYTGRFPGSFARGLPFQENPKTGDCRISGTGASLAGLEQALAEDSGLLREHAVRRILLIHGVILSIGGLPLIYLGDELGQLNDYGYKDDHAKAEDSRWAHRPAYDWAKYAHRTQTHTPEGRLYSDLHKMIELRRTHAVFAAGPMHVLDTGNEHVFGFERQNNGARAYFLGNFSEHPQTITLVNTGASYTDLISGRAVQLDGKFELGPYEQVWLA